MSNLIVSVVGPAGVGKGSVCRRVAEVAGLRHIDSGALYRAITVVAMKNYVSVHDKQGIADIARKTYPELILQEGKEDRILVSGHDITDLIRDPDVTEYASFVASNVNVREHVTNLCRKEAEQGDVIMDGRDINTVVFPDAQLSFCLDARVEERARRRWQQRKQGGMSVVYDQVLEEVKVLDRRDADRYDLGVLNYNKDRGDVYLDTTDMSEEDVVAYILGAIKGYRKECENSLPDC